MSLIRMDFFSETLNMMTCVNVILPLPRSGDMADLPVLYLLHGMGDDHTSWMRKTSIERYALQAGTAVVMPDGALSTYHNMEHGERYNDYIALELPEVIRSCFPVSHAREKTFIAGCSMGGFGALKIGLERPENYAAIGSLSAAIMEYRPESQFVQQQLHRVYDDDIDFCDIMMAANARATACGLYPVKIWHGWGDADILRPNAEKTRTFFESIRSPMLDYHWKMFSGGHDWALWDEMIGDFIRWLNLPEPKETQF